MLARTALYNFTDALVAASATTDALFEAISFRNLRKPVDEQIKVVRVEVFDGRMTVSPDSKQKEMGIRFEVQFWVTPDDVSQEALDDATDTSFDMARQWFDALHNDQSLTGQVCFADADEFETGAANLGATLRGVTYLYGEVNPIGEV